MSTEQFANNAQTTLSAAAASGDTSLTVASSSSFPSTPQFHILVDSEIMLVTALSGTGNTTWAVSRGQEGTAAAAHASGATVVGVLTAGALGALAALSALSSNYLINGGMDFAQRLSTPSTFTTVAGDKYSADRWRVPSQAASVQYAQTDTAGAPESGTEARSYGTWKQITNSGKFMVCQPVEGVNSVPLAGRTVTFLCKLKASANKTLRLGLICLGSGGTIDVIPAAIVPSTWGAASTDPTLGSNLSYQAPSSVPSGAGGTVSGNAVNCSVTTSWQLFGGTFAVPAGTKNVIAAVWTDSAFSANDSLSLTEAGLYDGAASPPWLPRPGGDELGLCQRFCLALNSQDLGVAESGTRLYSDGSMVFPATMRAAPSLLSGAFYTVNSGSAGTVTYSVTTLAASFANVAGNWTPTAIVTVTGVLDAEL